MTNTEVREAYLKGTFMKLIDNKAIDIEVDETVPIQPTKGDEEMEEEDELTIDIRETLYARYYAGDCECVVGKLDVLKKLSPTRKQIDQAITELNADLVKQLPRGTYSAIDGQYMYELLEDRLVLQIYLTETPGLRRPNPEGLIPL